MRIFVALKRVPDTNTRIEIDRDARSIRDRDVKFVISPYDEIALERAVQLKSSVSGASVCAVCVGPPDAQTILRQALAFGADDAVHIQVACPVGLDLDGHQVSELLAEALRTRPFDLLLCGRLAVDDQSAQVPTLTARKLGIPSVADVTKLELEGTRRARFHHLVEGRIEVVECALPAAASAQKGLAEPHYPSVKDILGAKKKPIEVLLLQPPEPALEIVSLEPPPARKPGRIVGKGVEAVPELVRLLRTEAKVL